jgi:O-antigen/teichoic acid export membrane protein
MVCAAVIAIGSLLAFRERANGIFGPSIVVGSANTVAMMVCVPPSAWILGSGRARKSYAISALATVIRTLGVTLPLLFHASPWFMGVGTGSAALFQAISMYRAARRLGYSRRYVRLSFHFRPASRHLLFGLNASASTANELATNYVDKIILGAFRPLRFVGLFQGVSAATSGVFLVGMTLQGYIFSWFVAERSGGRPPDALEAVRAIRLFSILIVALPYVVSLWLFARAGSILAWWLHVHSSSAVYSMQLVLVAVLVNLAYVPAVQRLLADGKAGVVGRAAGASALVNVVLSLSLVFSMSLVGVSLASLIAVCAALVVFTTEATGRICVRASAPGLIMAISVAPVGFVLQRIFNQPGLRTDVIFLAALCAVGAAILLVARHRISMALRWLERPASTPLA